MSQDLWSRRNSHEKPISKRKTKIQNYTHFQCNPTTEASEDDHEADPLVAEISVPLPQAEPPHLLENQCCGLEEAQERDSLL